LTLVRFVDEKRFDDKVRSGLWFLCIV